MDVKIVIDFFLFVVPFISIFICQVHGLADLFDPSASKVPIAEYQNYLKEFEKEIKAAAADLLDSHSEYDQNLERRRRSTFTIDDHVHHSYIFDMLPDKIHDLYIDGSDYSTGGLQGLEGVRKVSHLPVLHSDRTKGHLLTVFNGKEILFYSYNKTAPALAQVSAPIDFYTLTNQTDGSIVSFITVAKNLYRLDLDRILIIQGRLKTQSFVAFYKVFSTLPSSYGANAFVYKLVSGQIKYEPGEEILSMSATTSHISLHRSPKYKIWLAVLVRKHGKTIIDVYNIEDFHGWYRYSTLASFNSKSQSAYKVQVYKMLEFIAVFEISGSPIIHVTAFIGRSCDTYHPFHVSIKIHGNNTVTHLDSFTYGSRSFVLIATSGKKQYVKEVISSSGNMLKFVDFEVLFASHGERWLVVNIPGCREEKLLYLFHTESGVKKIKIYKMDKNGLIPVYTQPTCPVHYLAPSKKTGTFSQTGGQFYNLEDARKACIDDTTCIGIAEKEAKNYVLGFLYFTPYQGTKSSLTVWLKYSAPDAADFHCLLSTSDPVYSTLINFNSNENAHVFVQLLSGESYIVNLLTHLENKVRKIVLQNAKVYNKLKNLTEVIDKHESVVNRTEDVLNNLVKPNGNMSLWGNNTFENLTANHGVVTNNFTAWKVIWDDSNLTVEDLNIGVDDLDYKINKIHNDLENLQAKLEDAVFIDEEAVITGNKWFSGIIKISSRLEALNLHINTIEGTDVENLLNDTYRRDDPKPINGKKTYTSSVKVTDNVKVSSLNQLNISQDIVTINTDQIIYSQTTISHPVTITKNIHAHSINGINFCKEAIPLDSNRTVTGRKYFQDYLKADTLNMVEHATVDEVDLSKLSTNVLTINGGEVVRGNLTFVNDLVVTYDAEIELLSGIDVRELYENTAFVSSETFITGQKHFLKSVEVDAEIYLNGFINGMKTSDLFTKTQPHYFLVEKYFYYLQANVMEVDGLVSNVKLPHEIVTLTTDQQITGTHYFTSGITVNGNISLNGTVDEIDISDLRDICLLVGVNETYIAQNITFFGNVTVRNYIKVGGHVNGFDLGQCFNDTVYDFEDKVTIKAPKEFSSNLNCSHKFIFEGKVNGFNLPKDFVDLSSDQVIAGHKEFDYVKFSSNLNTDGLIDQTDIVDTANSVVTLTTEQEITSLLKFSSVVNLTGDLGLSFYRTVDAVDVSKDLVCRHSLKPQDITGFKIFNNLYAKKLYVRHDMISDNIDDIDVSKLYENRITLESSQHVPVEWKFGDNTVEHLTVNKFVNGLNLTEWVGDIMSLTKDQWIPARKYFDGLTPEIFRTTILGYSKTYRTGFKHCRKHRVQCKIVKKRRHFYAAHNLDHINRLRYTPILMHAKSFLGINGHKLNEIRDVAVNLFHPTNVTGKFTFKEPLWISGDVSLFGLLDGVNITYLYRVAVRKHNNLIYHALIGEKIFENGFHVEGDVRLVGKLNGFKVPDDTLTVKTSQFIHGVQYTFNNTVTIHPSVANLHNITVCNQYDQSQDVTFDLSDFAKYAARTDRNQTIIGDITFNKTLIVDGHVILTGTIDGENIAELYNQSIFTNGSQVVNGNLVLESNSTVVINGDIHTVSLNGRNFAELVNNSLRINEHEVIGSPKKFGHVIIIDTLKADKLVVHSLINGVNVTQTSKDAVYLQYDEIITGTLSFGQTVVLDGQVKTSGFVNHVDLSEQVVTVNTNQNITGEKEFISTFFSKNVHVEGHVNHHCLSKLSQDTLKVSEDQIIKGHKWIKNANFANLQCSSVNGMDTKDYVTLDTTQTIKGHLQFNDHTVFNHLYVQGLINGKNITEIEENALFKDENETVHSGLNFEGHATFAQNVTFKPNKTIDSVDLSWLKNDHERFWHYTGKHLMNLSASHQEICYTTNSLQHVLEKAPMYIDYMSHPIIFKDIMKFSHLFFTGRFIIGIKEDWKCATSDTVVFDAQSLKFIYSATALVTSGKVESVKLSDGFILFHKRHDDCLASPSLFSFVVDSNTGQAIIFSSEIANAIHVDILATNLSIFVSFVFGGQSGKNNIAYRVDRLTLQKHKIVFPQPAQSDKAVFLLVHDAIYLLQTTDKHVCTSVQVDEIHENSSDASNTHFFETYKLNNILPVTIGDHQLVISYLPSSKTHTSYKFLPQPQPATFTLYSVSKDNGTLSLMPHQFLTINAIDVKVFSTTLGKTTKNYVLFLVDKAVHIYIYHGVNNYELSGVIDMAPSLAPGEAIWLMTVAEYNVLPAIVVQTTIPRTFIYPAETNGWALHNKKLLPCH